MATNPQLWPPLAEAGSRSSWCLEEEEICIIMVADGSADQLLCRDGSWDKLGSTVMFC